MSIEIEKKYRLTPEQRQDVLDALDEFSAEYEGEDFEENILFANDVLFEKNALVRIRRTRDKTMFTYKQRIQSQSDAKRQIEHETEVVDADSLLDIVEALGLQKRIVYEKRRKTWKFRQVEVVLDELPFGLFMEIEGSVSAIKEAEMLLDIEEFEVEHETYPRLTGKFGKANGEVIEARFDQIGGEN